MPDARPVQGVRRGPHAVDPLTLLTLPWSCVLHDNHRLMPARVGTSVRLITSPQYRSAKADAVATLMQQWGRREKLAGDVVLHARAYFPDRRKRDAGNYRKLVTDALTGIAYADDAQLACETWERAGFDRENPRVEVTLTPLP